MVPAMTSTTNSTTRWRNSRLSPTVSVLAVDLQCSRVEDTDTNDAEHTTQQASTAAEDDASFGRPHTEVFSFSDFVKYRLGCDLFSDSSWKTPIEKGKVVTPAKAMMALSFKAESMPTRHDAVELLVKLVSTLSTPSPSAFTFKDLPNAFDHAAEKGLQLSQCASPGLRVTLATASTPAGDPLFVVHPPGEIDRFPWVVATPDASTVLQIFRRGWVDMRVIARELAKRGARFSTVVAVEGRVAPPARTPIRGLGTRGAAFRPSAADYDAYVRRRGDVLKGPRGRAALMHGGLVARIARDVLDVDAVLRGPTRGGWVQVARCGWFALCDDRLTVDELDVVCGVYYVHCVEGAVGGVGPRGDGSQTHLSWWPQASAWDAARCFLRAEWTELAEEFYHKWLGIRRAAGASAGGGEVIFGATAWRSKMRRQNTVTAAVEAGSECWQAGYLKEWMRAL